MLRPGYLLMEVMVSLMLVVISTASFTYYSYHLIQCQTDALRECHALSIASSHIDSIRVSHYKEHSKAQPIKKGEYMLSVSIAPVTCTLLSNRNPRGTLEYQDRFKLVSVNVSWKTSRGEQRSEILQGGMIADEDSRRI